MSNQVRELVINFSVHNVPGAHINRPLQGKEVDTRYSNSQKAGHAIGELQRMSAFDPDEAVLFLKGTSDFGAAFLLKWVSTFGFRGKIALDCPVNTPMIMPGQLGHLTKLSQL